MGNSHANHDAMNNVRCFFCVVDCESSRYYLILRVCLGQNVKDRIYLDLRWACNPGRSGFKLSEIHWMGWFGIHFNRSCRSRSYKVYQIVLGRSLQYTQTRIAHLYINTVAHAMPWSKFYQPIINVWGFIYLYARTSSSPLNITYISTSRSW